MNNLIISLPRSGSSSLGAAFIRHSSAGVVMETDDRCPPNKKYANQRLLRPCDVENFPETLFKLVLHHYTNKEMEQFIDSNRSLFLYRENLFELALSMTIYREFGRVHNIRVSQKYWIQRIIQADYYNNEITITREKFDRAYKTYHYHFERLMDIHNEYAPCSPIITYEQLYYRDKEATLRFINDYFGYDLNIDKALKFMEPSVGKLNTYENVTNIDEIMSWREEYENGK